MLILDLWGISIHAVVVFGLGKKLLFKSILGHCVELDFLPWCSGVCRTNFGILFELFGGESWSKSIKRSDSVGLVRVEIAIASLLLEDEDDMVWKKLPKN